jgi:hypothetical protein
MRLDLVVGSSSMAPMASKEGDSVIPITGESGSSLNIGFSDSIWANWINSGEEGPGAIAHGVLGRVAVRLQVALSSSGLDFWWRSARVGSLDAALWRLCNPGLLAGLTDGCSLLGIGSWLKRLVAFGETADSPVGTGGRGISGGGVGGCCILRRGETANVPERRGELVLMGETMLRPNVIRRPSFSLN